MYKTEVVTKIDDVGKDTLDELSNDGFFTYEWFKTLELSRVFWIIPRYFTVVHENEIVAMAPCFIEYTSQYRTLEDLSPLAKKARIISGSLGFPFHPPLICGSPSSFHSEILIQKGHNKKTILDLVCKKIDDTCRKERVMFSSFPFVSEFDKTLMTSLQSFGYEKTPSFVSAYMDIKWSSFEGYLANLVPHTRKNILREIKENSRSGIVIEQMKSFYLLSQILSDLYSNLFSRKNVGTKSNLFQSSFFEQLANCARDRTRLFVAKKDNKIIGFCLCLEHRNVLDVFIAGFDYESLTKMDFTYFNLVYYAPIRMAIHEGFRRIHFRPSALEAKRLRGCEIEKSYRFVKCEIGFLNHLFKQYVKMRARRHGKIST